LSRARENGTGARNLGTAAPALRSVPTVWTVWPGTTAATPPTAARNRHPTPRVSAADLPGTPTLDPCQEPGTAARLGCQLSLVRDNGARTEPWSAPAVSVAAG